MDCGILPGREMCELKQKALVEMRIEHIGLDMDITRYKCLTYKKVYRNQN